MYEMELSLNLRFLAGKTLDQLSVGLFQLIFRLSEDISILTECDLSLIRSDASTFNISSESPTSAQYLLELIGEKVIDVHIKNKKHLLLVFSNGSHLSIYDSNEETESFNIVSSKHNILV